MHAESFEEKSEIEYNPNMYMDYDEDCEEEEAWGDLNSQVNYVSPIPVLTKKPAEKPRPEPVLPQQKSIINQKYFGIKPAAQKPEPKPQPKKNESEDQIYLKIEELNKVIETVKKEKTKNFRLKREYEEKIKMFNEAQEDIESIKQQVEDDIKKFNETEIEKFKREYKVFEMNQKALADLPSKKEREEIDAIKNMIGKIEEEGVVRHKKYKLNKDRLVKLKKEAEKKKIELYKRIETLDKLKPGAKENDEKESQSLLEQKKEIKIFDENSEIFSTGEKKIDTPLVEKTLRPEVIASGGSVRFLADSDSQPKHKPESLAMPEYSSSIPVLDQRKMPDGRILTLYESGHKEIFYPNGTRKEEYLNGYSVLFYTNNDVKQVFPDGKTLYFYSEPNTTHISYPDGSEIIRFSNGQVEKHYQDGSKKIKYVDGTVKNISFNGDEETVYPDSTRETIINGERSIFHPGGHSEITSKGVKKRVYLNGNTKLLNK